MSKKYIAIKRNFKVFLTCLLFIACKSSFSIAQNNLNLYPDVGVTSLMQSVASGDIEGVKFFAKINASEIDKRNIGGATALHIAVRGENLQIVETLLRFNANINITDNEGYSPLMRAASYGNDNIVAALLKRNPDLSLLNKKSESVIIQSAISDCDKCLNLILESIIPNRNFKITELKKQVKAAFTIASWKDNLAQKRVLLHFYERLSDRYEKRSIFIKRKTPTRQKKIIFIKKSNAKTERPRKKVKQYVPKKFILKKETIGQEKPEPITKYYLLKPQKVKQKKVAKEFILKKGKPAKKHYKKRRYKMKKKKSRRHKAKKISQKPAHKPVLTEFEPAPQGKDKTITLDGNNIISRDLDGDIEMNNDDIEKTFIIK